MEFSTHCTNFIIKVSLSGKVQMLCMKREDSNLQAEEL